MDDDVFDVIIVGAGLAGLAAAHTCAQAGLTTLVLERGDYPGAKNVTGGRMYVNPVRDLFPDLWAKAPLERAIVHEEIGLLSEGEMISIRLDSAELAADPPQSYSVLRSKFDRWFAKQAERQGAMVVPRTRVDDLVFEDGRVVGVLAGDEELRARLVIACDGVLSFLSERAGLRPAAKSANFAVGFKEVIELDRATLEARFNLVDDQGLAKLFMGDVTCGKFGGAFLYTNTESLSLGIVAGIDAMGELPDGMTAPVLLDRFKARPEIARLIAGGEQVEYSAHMIPEGGIKAMGRLYGDGILVAGDAAGLSMNIGITVRGMEYALASGYYAAQTAIKAAEQGDFSSQSLAQYEGLLKDSFVLTDFKSFQHALEVLEPQEYLFNSVPELAGRVFNDLYRVPAGPKERIFPTVRSNIGFRDVRKMLGLVRGFSRI